jgi:catechol 2,3-dioxygenase-like lactoylglutathione lyase family enzyme
LRARWPDEESAVLKTRGFNHIDLGTRDMEATRRFYEDLLGFPLVRADLVEIGKRGRMKHFFFDVGHGQLMGFMSGEDVAGFPNGFDAGINAGLGLPPGVYHFAFDAETEADLERIKHHLVSNGVEVNGPVDHEGWSKSIYFRDPNGLQLEVCHIVRPFAPDDAVPRVRFRLERGRKVEGEGA